MSLMVSRRRFLSGIGATAALSFTPFVIATPALAMPSSLAIDAAKKALSGDYQAAGELAQQSGDNAAIRFVEMLYLRDHGSEAGYARIMAFLDAAPNWPLEQTLRKRAEMALYDNSGSADAVLAHFGGRDPVTPYGSLALARANFATGNVAEGKKWLHESWGNSDMDAELETKCYSEFSSKLSSDDHRWRPGPRCGDGLPCDRVGGWTAGGGRGGAVHALRRRSTRAAQRNQSRRSHRRHRQLAAGTDLNCHGRQEETSAVVGWQPADCKG